MGLVLSEMKIMQMNIISRLDKSLPPTVSDELVLTLRG
jgi:hypothetical protein